MKKYIPIFLLGCVLITFVVMSSSVVQAQTSCPQVPSSSNAVTGTVSIAQDGTYKVWSRVIAPDSVNNSFWLQIDGGCAINVGDSPSTPVNTFSWVSFKDSVTTNDIFATLIAGDHVIKITEREGGVGLDRILFSMDTTCIPTGFGDNCPSSTVAPTITAQPTTVVPTTQPTPTVIPTTTPLPTAVPTKIPTPTPTRVPTATPTPVSQGLYGTYYNNSNFTGTSVVRRDTTINFNWGTNAPISGISKDTFSVRWTGKVLAPASGAYTFRTNSNDGVRLWVNGTRIINNWTDHNATYNTGTISLTAGQKYDIKLEYYDNSSTATIQLQWRTPSNSSYVTVPASQLLVQ